MAFQFRFGPVLSYRQHLRDRAEMDLARAQRALEAEREKLRRETRLLAKAWARFQAALSTPQPGNWVRDSIEYQEALKRRIERLEASVGQAKKVVTEKKRALLEAERAFRVMEKLEEKDFQSWRTEQELREQKRLDEIAVTRHGRDFP